MNYLAELNAFDRLLETVRLPMAAQLLWFRLIALANKGSWPEWIEVDNGRLAGMLGVQNKTMISARDRLIDKGLIQYKRGKGRGVGKYKMVSLMCKNDTTNYTSSYTSNYTSTQKKKEEKEKKQKKEKKEKNIIKTETETNKTVAVVKAYEANIGFMSPLVYQKVLAWLDDVDESLIVYAIEQAVLNNKATWAYINAVVDNHFKSGRKTRVEAERATKDKSKGNNKQSTNTADRYSTREW